MTKLRGHLISLSDASKTAVYSESSCDQVGFSSGGFNYEELTPELKEAVEKEERILEWPHEESKKALGMMFPENNSPSNSISKNYDRIYVDLNQSCYVYSRMGIVPITGDSFDVEMVKEANVYVVFFNKNNTLSLSFNHRVKNHSFDLELTFAVGVSNETKFLNQVIYNRDKLEKKYWEKIFKQTFGEIFSSIIEDKWKSAIAPYRISNWKELFASTCAVAARDPYSEFLMMGNDVSIQFVKVLETTQGSKMMY